MEKQTLTSLFRKLQWNYYDYHNSQGEKWGDQATKDLAEILETGGSFHFRRPRYDYSQTAQQALSFTPRDDG